MAKQITEPAKPVNQYSGRYAMVAANLQRVDQIENRLREIEHEKRAVGGRVPQAEAAARFVEVVRAKRERVAAQVRTVAALTSEHAPNLADFARSSYDLLDLLVLCLGDQIAEGGAAAILAAEYEPGLPVAEREEQRAKLTAERSALVVEHLDVVEALAGSGVTRANLPENQQEIERRAAEAKAEVTRRANFEEANARLSGRKPQPVR